MFVVREGTWAKEKRKTNLQQKQSRASSKVQHLALPEAVEAVRLQPPLVEEGAVGAAQVKDVQLGLRAIATTAGAAAATGTGPALQHGMVAGDRRVLQHDMTAWEAAKHCAALAQAETLDNSAVLDDSHVERLCWWATPGGGGVGKGRKAAFFSTHTLHTASLLPGPMPSASGSSIWLHGY